MKKFLYSEKNRILHYIPAFKFGGIESLILDIYENIDRNKIQFDFLVETKIDKEIKEDILQKGGRIYEIDPISFIHIVRYIKNIYYILKNNKYKIVHCHSVQTRPYMSIIAKIMKIPIRIIHSHSKQFNINKHVKIRRLMQNIAVLCSNRYLACSSEAAEFLFGKNKNVMILYNGIQLEKFKFDKTERNKIRKQLGIEENEKVLLHIGRMTYLKNQKFVIDVFEQLIKKEKQYKLLLIGNGEDESQLHCIVKEKKLENKILFLGYKKDITKYLSASDIFIFPSIAEGLGISMIEAQANGIPCICSNSIPKEVKKNSNVKYLDLKADSIQQWVKEIQNLNNKRLRHIDLQCLSEFDIKNVALKYQNYIMKELKDG